MCDIIGISKGEKMRKFFKLFGVSIASISSALIASSGYSATPRNVASVNVQRMPTMTIGGVNTSPNASPTLPTGAAAVPAVVCADGRIDNSKYTVDNCMQDVLTCVNSGALPNGMNDLFNEDLRNSIFNGMGLCSAQVNKCVSEVRQNCQNIYSNSSRVWIDFNARQIQPEYYSFVLRKTGLTPNQAENTCMLLDKNTYGTSFSAVSSAGNVSAEYDKNIGAYNSQAGGNLTKGQPQGVDVNQDAYDAQRGHYARWDATTGECLVRVAAYNKNEQIKNSWLFGAMGNDENAEVWKAAGNSFTCDKDLFGFSLMNKTKNVALIGVGGGTLAGAGIGAIAGHGKRSFDCTNDSALNNLSKQLRESGNVGVLNRYLEQNNKVPAAGNISEKSCNAILDVYDSYIEGASVDPLNCSISPVKISASVTLENFCCDTTATGNQPCTTCAADITNPDAKKYDFTKVIFDGKIYKVSGKISSKKQADIKANLPTDISYIPEKGTMVDCTFKDLQQGFANGEDIVCETKTGACIDGSAFKKQINELDDVFVSLEILKGEKSTMGAATAVGAGIGATAGGLATAITAFVEKNNISCRVGDGLKSVGFDKSYSIDSLKEFYVKWALNLPDTIMPTTYVSDCDSWRSACASLTDLNQCAIAQVNYRPTTASASQLVNTACTVSGSSCIENSVVTTSYGACVYQ